MFQQKQFIIQKVTQKPAMTAIKHQTSWSFRPIRKISCQNSRLLQSISLPAQACGTSAVNADTQSKRGHDCIWPQTSRPSRRSTIASTTYVCSLFGVSIGGPCQPALWHQHQQEVGHLHCVTSRALPREHCTSSVIHERVNKLSQISSFCIVWKPQKHNNKNLDHF